MPVFQPRNRVQILREMVARVVARSRLVGVTRNSTVFHVMAGSAEEDAEQYFEMSRLRAVFSIDKATGSDLDERAGIGGPGITIITNLTGVASRSQLSIVADEVSRAARAQFDTQQITQNLGTVQGQ